MDETTQAQDRLARLLQSLDVERKSLQDDCLKRIEELRMQLNVLENTICSDATINDLGELQSATTILDCRLASLAVVKRLIRQSPARQPIPPPIHRDSS